MALEQASGGDSYLWAEEYIPSFSAVKQNPRLSHPHIVPDSLISPMSQEKSDNVKIVLSSPVFHSFLCE